MLYKEMTAVCSEVHTKHVNTLVLIHIMCIFIIFYYDQQKHNYNYFTNYHTPTCFNAIVSSSGSS